MATRTYELAVVVLAATCCCQQPAQAPVAAGPVTFQLGDQATLTALYSYPNNSAPQPLEQTIEHYLNQSLNRDGLAQVQAHVTPGATYVATLSGSGKGIDRYPDQMRNFLDHGKLADQATQDLKQQHLWQDTWRMFLPLGLALVNQRSVQLLHFPPDYSLTKQDYLNSKTTQRWEQLLVLNGVPEHDKSLYETIVDIAPIAAPASAGNTLPIAPYVAYAKAELELAVSACGAGEYTCPVVAYGAPVAKWVTDEYLHQNPVAGASPPTPVAAATQPLAPVNPGAASEKFRPLDTAYISVIAGKKTPVLGANHPSYIWNAKASQRFAIMLQDLTAACWQVAVAAAPASPIATVVADCTSKWQSRPLDVCVAVETQVCNLTQDAAKTQCTPDPSNPPDCEPHHSSHLDRTPANLVGTLPLPSAPVAGGFLQ